MNPDATAPRPRRTTACELAGAARRASLRLRLARRRRARRARRAVGADVRRDRRTRASRRGRRVLRRARIPPTLVGRRARGRAPGATPALLWSKQFYHYVVQRLARGRPGAAAAAARAPRSGRNHDWRHLYNRDVISMPDKWEYPWYAAWDLAFHMLPFARIDPHFAKEQLVLFLREWYMHPNGQLPAYEFAFGDVNPPVHAWAAWRVYKMTGARGAARPRLPGARLPEAAAQLHLVGEPQGRRGQQPVRRRLPRPRQHRRLRPLAAAADRRHARAGRRHRLDGVLLRHHAVDGARAGARTTRPTRTWRRSSSSTSSPSPTR